MTKEFQSTFPVPMPEKLSIEEWQAFYDAEKAYQRCLISSSDELDILKVSKSPHHALRYALEMVHGPWPMGEPAIARDMACMAIYRVHVLGQELRSAPAAE